MCGASLKNNVFQWRPCRGRGFIAHGVLNSEGGKPENMCEVLDRAEERGRIKGIQEGIDESRIESIKNVMSAFKITAEQAMDVLKIPFSEQDKYLSKL